MKLDDCQTLGNLRNRIGFGRKSRHTKPKISSTYGNCFLGSAATAPPVGAYPPLPTPAVPGPPQRDLLKQTKSQRGLLKQTKSPPGFQKSGGDLGSPGTVQCVLQGVQRKGLKTEFRFNCIHESSATSSERINVAAHFFSTSSAAKEENPSAEVCNKTHGNEGLCDKSALHTYSQFTVCNKTHGNEVLCNKSDA